MEIFSEVIQLFFSIENFLAIAVGVVIGVVVGSIPGLTATMAVALALPFTFSMQPIAAILLLVGIYKGGYVRRVDYGNLNPHAGLSCVGLYAVGWLSHGPARACQKGA